jgi:hypothetical protein
VTSFDRFLTALHQLHKDAGSPSSREISKLSEQRHQPISHSTVNDLLKGKRGGAWRTVARMVDTLAYIASDVDASARIHDLWVQQQAVDADEPTRELLGLMLQELRDQRAMLERLIDTIIGDPHAHD